MTFDCEEHDSLLVCAKCSFVEPKNGFNSVEEKWNDLTLNGGRNS